MIEFYHEERLLENPGSCLHVLIATTTKILLTDAFDFHDVTKTLQTGIMCEVDLPFSL